MNHLDTFHQGVAAANYGNPICARSYFERALEGQADNPDLWVWLAWTAYSPKEALSFLKQAKSLSPDSLLIEAYQVVLSALATYECVEAPLRTSLFAMERTHASDGSEMPEPDLGSEAQPQDALPSTTVGNAAPSAETTFAGDVRFTSEVDDRLLLSETERDNLAALASSEPIHVQHSNADDTPIFNESAEQLPDQLTASVHSCQGETQPSVAAPKETSDVNQPWDWDGAPEKGRFDLSEDHQPALALEAGPPTILAVDDNPTVLKLISTTLERHGYRVETAPDGIEAMKVLARLKPNLILLDISMQGMDGYKVCKMIKSRARTNSIPVVMVSGKDGVFDKIRGKIVGCDDYITKPFELNDLLTCVKRHIAACPMPPTLAHNQ